MKELLAASVMAFAAVAAAQTYVKHGKTQPPEAQRAEYAAARKALPNPPPYGAYFLQDLHDPTGKSEEAARLAIAKHYGYATAEAARNACAKVLNRWECTADIVAHRRHESSEIKKYGFANWKAAVSECKRNRVPDYGPVSYCEADPFLVLRAKQ